MPIDLSHSDQVRDLVAQTECFVRDHVLPVEDAHGGDIDAAVLGEVDRDFAYARVRPFRTCDGPSEVHRWAIAERAVGAARRAAAAKEVRA